MSGLHINLNKSVFVLIVISEQLIYSNSGILGCRRNTFLIKYLGLLLSIKKLKKQDFLPLILPLKHLGGWKSHLLSISGRHILICSVMSASPLHYMHAFHLPTWLTKNLDRLAWAFLWKGNESCMEGHCLVNWLTVFLPKANSGLGIRDLKAQDTALLMRWLWKIASNDQSLWIVTVQGFCSNNVLTLEITVSKPVSKHLFLKNCKKKNCPNNCRHYNVQFEQLKKIFKQL